MKGLAQSEVHGWKKSASLFRPCRKEEEEEEEEEEGKVKEEEEKKYLASGPQSRKICRREEKTKIEIRANVKYNVSLNRPR
jgi:hypothetical protein